MKTETENQEPKVAKLRAMIMAMVASLQVAVSRYRKNETALAANQQTLQAAQSDREKHAQSRVEIESLSAVGLHRRKLSPEAAAALADEEKIAEEAARGDESKATEERSQLESQRTDDFLEIKRILPDLSYRSLIFGEAEFLAELGSMIEWEGHHLPVLTEGTSDRIFSHTRAYAVYEKRVRQIRGADAQKDSTAVVVAIAEEILAQPIVPLRQGPPKLPHPNNARIAQDLDEVLLSSSR
ncbi:MAG: hypothetical protein H0X40_02990 [Chthoniobacterales bacterium]|nr:hypothetical protein [Chthoniobacterales bacterium]